MSIDRRRTIRVACDLPVLWKRGWRRVEARARDLNADGLFLLTDATTELDHVMDLHVTLDDGDLAFLGVARYIGPTRHGRGIGVAIHAISADDRKRWQAHYHAALERMIDSLPGDVARHLRVPGLVA